MQTIDAKHDFVSTGQLAAHLQVSVRAIERAAVKLDISPAMRINHVSHFDGEQVERLTAELREVNPGEVAT